MGAAAKKARYMVNRKSVRIFKRISEARIPGEIGKRFAKTRRRKYMGRLLTTAELTMKGGLAKVMVYLSLMRDPGDRVAKSPLTLSLSPPARLGELASQRGRIRKRMRLGERTPEFTLRIIQGSLLPVRTRLRVRQQKMQARQGVLARRRTG